MLARVSRDFLVLKDIRRDFVGSKGFKEDRPGGKNNEGGKGDNVGKEPRSFGRCLSSGLPGRLEEIEHGMPGEGQKIEGRQGHSQKLFAMAKIMLEFITV